MGTKILVLSIAAWNSNVGMDTWPSLLAAKNPDEVANITLRGEKPDSDVCNNYFHLSENKVIKSILNRSLKTGSRVERVENVDQPNEDLLQHNKRYNKMKSRRSFITLMAREILWTLGKWKTPELHDFITNFNPDVILYSMDGYIHFNRICRYAKRISSAKSIGFFVDDNFTYKQSSKLGDKLFRVFQRHSLKKLSKQTDAFWAITEMTKKEADETFDINCTVLTKPIRNVNGELTTNTNKPFRILYTGNLMSGRDRSLVRLVNVLKKINEKEQNFIVDVYTKTFLSDEVKNAIECDCCHLHEPIPQKEVFELQKQSDILLFLEDIDGPDAHTARLSFSTKITDYLSSGRCIFAIGCSDTAPIQYFANNKAAIVASTDKEIENGLLSILSDTNLLIEFAKNAQELGFKNHNKETILKIFDDVINQVLNKEVK